MKKKRQYEIHNMLNEDNIQEERKNEVMMKQ